MVSAATGSVPRAPRGEWGAVAKTLHWLLFVLVLIQVPAGFLMSDTYPLAVEYKKFRPMQTLFGQIHHTIGFTILILVFALVAWRVFKGAPPPAQNRFPLQGVLSRAVHILLCLVLIIMPLSGWAALSSFASPLWLFNNDKLIPPILPVAPILAPLGYTTFARIHRAALLAGVALLSVHVLASLWRHWWLKDDVFRRMWPLAGARR
jgi:cytochrome b561